MSDKPSAAWYLAPIFLGIIGSAIMWYVLKDEDHPDAPKMVKKGWVIGIVLTVISFAWIPLMLIPMMVFDVDQMGDHMRLIPDEMKRMITELLSCDSSYPDVCIPSYPPDLDCGEILYANFEVLQPDPHGFDRDKDGIGCES